MPKEQRCCKCCQQCCLPKAERAFNSTFILIISVMGLTSSCNVMHNILEMPKSTSCNGNIVHHSILFIARHPRDLVSEPNRDMAPNPYFYLQDRGALDGSTAVGLIYHYSHGPELQSRYYTFKQSGTDFKVLYQFCSDLHSSTPFEFAFLYCFGCST